MPGCLTLIAVQIAQLPDFLVWIGGQILLASLLLLPVPRHCFSTVIDQSFKIFKMGVADRLIRPTRRHRPRLGLPTLWKHWQGSHLQGNLLNFVKPLIV